MRSQAARGDVIPASTFAGSANSAKSVTTPLIWFATCSRDDRCVCDALHLVRFTRLNVPARESPEDRLRCHTTSQGSLSVSARGLVVRVNSRPTALQFRERARQN